eukprot:6193474-Pleurochrysis_carterae.AAC.3
MGDRRARQQASLLHSTRQTRSRADPRGGATTSSHCPTVPRLVQCGAEGGYACAQQRCPACGGGGAARRLTHSMDRARIGRRHVATGRNLDRIYEFENIFSRERAPCAAVFASAWYGNSSQVALGRSA